MSLRDAIALVASELPLATRERIIEASRVEDSECSGRGFAFRRNRRPSEFHWILQRRLAMADSEELREWIEGQLKLVSLLGEAGVLFQGYVVEDGYRYEFSIAPSLGRFVTYRSLL